MPSCTMQTLPRQTAKVHPQDDTKQCTYINTKPFQTHASYSYDVTKSLAESSGFPAASDPGQRDESLVARAHETCTVYFYMEYERVVEQNVNGGRMW